VALAVVGGAVVGYGWWTYSRVDRVDLDLAEIRDAGPRNYLVIGSDSREEIDAEDPNAGVMLGEDKPAGRRSDSIAILRVDPGTERVDVLSIPRDLWVTMPSGEEQRINTAYAKSTQALIDTIDKNLGIPIHHFAEVDFNGFQKLIDAVGGVPMYFDSEVRDTNSGLRIREPGCHVLNGPTGLAFARSRHLEWKDSEGWHTDGSGDLGRITRQQMLMRAAMDKASTLGLDDVGRLKGLVDAGLESTTIDSGLGFSQLMALGSYFSDFDSQRLQTHSLAVTPDRTSGGASIVRLDEAASAETLALFRGTAAPSGVTTTTAPPPSSGDVTVDIYNAGAAEGEARRVSWVLAEGGFVVGAVDTASEPVKLTTVRHAPGTRSMGELVAGWLGPAPKVVEDPDVEAGHVTVELAADFDSISEPSEGPEQDGGDSVVETTAPAEDGSEAAGGNAGSSSTSSTTTTTVAGWTPGVAPEGITCG
jgi:LCP family protein required for cell wall assembly